PARADGVDARRWAYAGREGRACGDVPLTLEYKREGWDSPNSAGVIIDAVRAAKVAKDRGIGGPVGAASAYLMKSPPKQLPDDIARTQLGNFITGSESPRALPSQAWRRVWCANTPLTCADERSGRTA